MASPRDLARVLVVSCLVLTPFGCKQKGCEGLEDVGQCGPALVDLVSQAALPANPAPYRLYVDRSGSMTGYLDTTFEGEFGVQAGSSSLRRQLGQLLSDPNALTTAVYGFGEHVVPVQATSNTAAIRQLLKQGFYRDNDTRLEDVLDSIQADGNRTAVHLIITDGRRGSGDAAIAQYERMGQLARMWTSDTSRATGGVFAIAVVNAPFHQVRSDQAGCWAAGHRDGRHEEEEGQEEAEQHARAPMRCPLYTFAFIPRRSAGPVLQRLQETATRLFVRPTFPTSLVLQAAHQPSASTLNVQGGKGSGQPLHLYFTSESETVPEKDSVAVTGEPADYAGGLALDDSLAVRVRSAAIVPGSGGGWQELSDLRGAWVGLSAVRRDTAARRIGLRLELRARKEVAATRYQIEIVSAGKPGWLRDYEATKQREPTRTYGLSALLNQLPQTATPLGRLYVSIY